MSRTLSKRELTLAWLVGLIVVLGGTFLLGQSYLGKRTALIGKIAADKRQLRSLQEMLKEGSFWEQREAWVQAKQPKLDNPDQAGVQLLDYVKDIAQKNSVLLENATLHTAEARPSCISVALEVETKSPWAPLVSFLEELQTPEQFVALEMANLKVDAADNTQVHGRFKIARWYAPH